MDHKAPFYNGNSHLVLLAGGSGTRFAPLSTEDLPKQFLNVVHPGKSLIREAYERAAPICSNVLVSTNVKYVGLTRQHLPEITEGQIVAEPLKKNTAPAMALISHCLQQTNPGAVLLFTPSDHYVHDLKRAREILASALEYASKEDVLVTCGIVPEFASPDYGYIKFEPSASPFKTVRSFVEKPNAEVAADYIRQGCYYWNSGMFAWRADVLLEAVRRYLPRMHALLEECFPEAGGWTRPERVRVFFEKVESISIDYGIMEKADNVKVIPFDAGWSDVGTWKGLSELRKRYALTLPKEVLPHVEAFERGL